MPFMGFIGDADISFSAKKYDLQGLSCFWSSLDCGLLYQVLSVIPCRKFEVLLASLRRSQNTKILIPCNPRKRLTRKNMNQWSPWRSAAPCAGSHPQGQGAVPFLIFSRVKASLMLERDHGVWAKGLFLCSLSLWLWFPSDSWSVRVTGGAESETNTL